MRSIENIADEIIDLKRKGVKILNFGDDTISADTSRLLAICNLQKNIGMKWSCECRVDAMTNDLAITLANSGCVGLQFGVESGSQESLDRMGKNITINQIEQAVRWCIKAGLKVVCSLMIGTPEDTLETMKQTIDFAEKLQKEYKAAVILACTVPYPGTYYSNHATDLGISISTKNYNLYSTINPIMDTHNFTRWQIRNLYFESISRLFKSLSVKYREIFTQITRNSLEKEGYRVSLSKPR
ncbi:unnamed protein product [marine sediment metagenome]|uniref:Radical SAM core domain-containing protein n=1 Tax=marine sediment metagenome TaxID=412755 RepID=X1RGL7_9ZZZZ